jgi:hypothetical protein
MQLMALSEHRCAPPRLLAAEDVWNIYRLRWEVETFFKTTKSGCAMSDTPSRDKHKVQILIYAALLRATLAMKAKTRFVRLVPATNGRRINPQQWMRWWNRQLHLTLARLVAKPDLLDFADLFYILSDPNARRTPTRNAFAGAE